jgi:hypothetical protein
MQELAGVDVNTAPERYANQAKVAIIFHLYIYPQIHQIQTLLGSLITAPSIDTLRGLVLISFHEHAYSRRDSQS